jgi:hypothetical protein
VAIGWHGGMTCEWAVNGPLPLWLHTRLLPDGPLGVGHDYDFSMAGPRWLDQVWRS